MTREEVFKLWPRPWRLDEEDASCVLAANGIKVVAINSGGTFEQDEALAQMLVEWSQEKP